MRDGASLAVRGRTLARPARRVGRGHVVLARGGSGFIHVADGRRRSPAGALRTSLLVLGAATAVTALIAEDALVGSMDKFAADVGL